MLYDTPFPTEPQTEHIKKTDRNAEIIARYKTGELGANIAKEFGISEQRVNQIVRRRRN
jgi:Mor family transcriptional regulator